MKPNHIIYGMFDNSQPLPPHIRYVGYTGFEPQGRIAEHMQEAKKNATCHRHHWLRSLAKRGVTPAIITLEKVSIKTWQKREQHWISKLAHLNLVNSTAGGEGLINPSADVRNRISKKVTASLQGNQRRTGILHDSESRKAISAGLLNSQKKKDADARMRGKPGRLHTQESKDKVRQAKLGKPHPRTPEWTQKLADSNKGRRWINDGIHEKSIKGQESVADGWNYGRLPVTLEQRAKLSAGVRLAIAAGKIYTPERNAKISASKKGKTRQKIAQSNICRHWINDGVNEKSITGNDMAPQGWVIGRLPVTSEQRANLSKAVRQAMADGKIFTPERNAKIALARAGKKWITSGLEIRQIKKDDPLPKGWIYGMKLRG